MRIGFIGDIIGKPGRTIIKERLQEIKLAEKLDVVIANGENASHGFGLTKNCAQELLNAGVDIITSGNHIWDKKEILAIIDDCPHILRPHNMPKAAPGSGVGIYNFNQETLAVINLMGHYGMPQTNNVFEIALQTTQELKAQNIKHIFIDFHAEATSEKRGLFWLLSGKVSAVIGTHTHVGTDDLEIANGTLGLSDAGGCGCMDGILGLEAKGICKRFLSGIPCAFEIPDKCVRILPIIIFETNSEGECILGYKIRAIDSLQPQKMFEAFSYQGSINVPV